MAVIRLPWVISLLCFFNFFATQAQVITTSSDTTIVTTTSTPPDSLSGGLFGTLKSWDKPSRAALYSTIIPGAGQFYNKSYWKIPILYAGSFTIGYFLNKYHKLYLSFRSSYEVRISAQPLALPDRYAVRYTNINSLTNARDGYRRFRDYDIIFAILLYGLNISEAYVDAHLKGFDISDELSYRVEPTLIAVPTIGYLPGVALRINLKNP